MRDLFRTPWFLATVDEDIHVVRRARTAERFPDLATVEAQYEGLVRALDLLPRREYGTLIDLRLAPPRNDAGYEEVIGRYHRALYRDFRAVAVLVATAAGRLQVRRFVEASRPDAKVFIDEAEALAFLHR